MKNTQDDFADIEINTVLLGGKEGVNKIKTVMSHPNIQQRQIEFNYKYVDAHKVPAILSTSNMEPIFPTGINNRYGGGVDAIKQFEPYEFGKKDASGQPKRRRLELKSKQQFYWKNVADLNKFNYPL